MFAYVKFAEDGEKYVVNTNDIRKFDTQFNAQKLYKVKYKDGHFYRAHIACIAETEEQLQNKIKEKRLKFPSAKLADNVTDVTTTDDDFEPLAQPTGGSRRKQISNKITENNYNRMLKENVYSQNIIPENNSQNEEIYRIKEELNRLKNENKVLKDKNSALEELNFQLQREVIDKVNKALAVDKVLGEREKAIEAREFKICERLDEKVHLSRGIWLPVPIFDTIFRKKKHTIFLKELAVAIIGEEILISTTISKINATFILAIQDVYRVWLTEKNIVGDKQTRYIVDMDRILNEKAQDLKRAGRQKKKQNRVVEAENFEDEMTEGEAVQNLLNEAKAAEAVLLDSNNQISNQD